MNKHVKPLKFIMNELSYNDEYAHYEAQTPLGDYLIRHFLGRGKFFSSFVVSDDDDTVTVGLPEANNFESALTICAEHFQEKVKDCLLPSAHELLNL